MEKTWPRSSEKPSRWNYGELGTSLKPIKTGRPKYAKPAQLNGNWNTGQEPRFKFTKKKIVVISVLILILGSLLTGPNSPLFPKIPVLAASDFNSFSHTRTTIFNNTAIVTSQWNFNSTCLFVSGSNWQFDYALGTAGSGGNNCASADILQLKAPVNFQTVTNKMLEITQGWGINPVGTSTLVASYAGSNDGGDALPDNGDGAGQCFQPSSTVKLTQAKLTLLKVGGPTGTARARLYATTGTFGTTCTGTGSFLAESLDFDLSTLTTSSVQYTFTFSGVNQVQINSGTTYWIGFQVISCPTCTAAPGDYPMVREDSTSPTHAGNCARVDGGSWFANAACDTLFEVTGTTTGVPTTFLYFILRTNGTMPSFKENWNPIADEQVRFLWRVCPSQNTALCGSNGFQDVLVAKDLTKSINEETVDTDRVIGPQNLDPFTAGFPQKMFQTVLNFTGSTNQITYTNTTGSPFQTSKIAAHHFQQAIDYFIFVKPEFDTTQAPCTACHADWLFNRNAITNAGKTFGIWSVPAVCADPVNVNVSPCNVAPPTGYGPPSLSELNLFDPRTWVNALAKSILWIFLTAVPQAVLFMVSAAIATLTLVLDFIGNNLGLGPLGTYISQTINEAITFFTQKVPTIFANTPAIFSRFIDSLSIVFPWLPIALSVAVNIATLGINGILYIPTIVSLVFQLVSAGFVIYFIMFWFIYTGDDALGGALAFMETTQWLVLGIGLKWVSLAANFAIDIITALVGLVPKPFIQMVAHKFPRLPILETSSRFVNPSFDLGELRAGNMFSVLLWMVGALFLAWYNSFTPALPGSIAALLPATAPNMVALKNMLPLLEFMTVFTGIICFGVTGLKVVGMAGLHVQTPFTVGPGRRVSGGPGGIRVIRTRKRFQARLEKKIARRTIVPSASAGVG